MPTLGLCVIAKNAAATIRGCLESVIGLVECMVVVDTGSTDATEEIARQAGARVLQFAWTDDFSAARNAALAAIGTDWVLVLDADEELDGAAHAWIRAELASPRAEGYVVPVRNYLKPWDQPLTGVHPVPPSERHPRAPDSVAYTPSEVCRLYRRAPDVYYMGHVHEQVEYRLMQLGRRIGRAEFFIHHFGWYLIDAKGLERKRTLYYDLIAKKIKDRPDDPQVLLQYGDALCTWHGKHEEGLACFMKAAALKSKDKSVWMYIATALLKLGQLEGALIAVGQIPAEGEFAGRRAQLKGEALGALERWEEARVALLEAHAHMPESRVVQAQLALLEITCGNDEGGKRRMRKLIKVIEQQAFLHREAFPFLCAAELHAQIKQWPDALRLAVGGLECDPDSLPLLDLRLKAAVATERLDEAAEAAARIAELAPAPRSVLRHAAILNQNGNRAAAAQAISCGLERFPLSHELQQAGLELGLGSVMAGAQA